jgi:hypothetical protein
MEASFEPNPEQRGFLSGRSARSQPNIFVALDARSKQDRFSCEIFSANDPPSRTPIPLQFRF